MKETAGQARTLAVCALDEDAAEAIRDTLRFWMTLLDDHPDEPFPLRYLVGHLRGAKAGREAVAHGE